MGGVSREVKSYYNFYREAGCPGLLDGYFQHTESTQTECKYVVYQASLPGDKLSLTVFF